MSTPYTLIVDIAPDQVTTLKNAGYNLCISKKVNGEYCVVWQGTSFDVTNTFQWTESYQTFASAQFQDGALVTAATNVVPIALGQTTTIDQNGVLANASGPETGSSFTVVNNWRPCNIAVNQLVQGKFLPVFVDPEQTVLGTETLTPIVSVLAFFSRTLKTSSMFENTQSATIETVYQGSTSMTISYVDTGNQGNGIWISGTKATGFSSVVPRSYARKTGFTSLPIAYDAFAIAALVNKFNNGDGLQANSLPYPLTCPIVATMTFSEYDQAKDMQTIINYRNAQPNGWPEDSRVSVGIPNLDGHTVTVTLDISIPGGPSAPVIALWNAFCKSFSAGGPKSVSYAAQQ